MVESVRAEAEECGGDEEHADELAPRGIEVRFSRRWAGRTAEGKQ